MGTIKTCEVVFASNYCSCSSFIGGDCNTALDRWPLYSMQYHFAFSTYCEIDKCWLIRNSLYFLLKMERDAMKMQLERVQNEMERVTKQQV